MESRRKENWDTRTFLHSRSPRYARRAGTTLRNASIITQLAEYVASPRDRIIQARSETASDKREINRASIASSIRGTCLRTLQGSGVGGDILGALSNEHNDT